MIAVVLVALVFVAVAAVVAATAFTATAAAAVSVAAALPTLLIRMQRPVDNDAHLHINVLPGFANAYLQCKTDPTLGLS